MLIINPGSGPVDTDGQGWTNTYATACTIAADWHAKMRDAGIGDDVELVLPAPADTDDPPPADDGRWTFQFHHTITGVTVELQTHGVDDLEAWAAGRILGAFGPRQYWKGSSSGDPQLDDWAAEGFVQTYRPAGDRAPASVVPTYHWPDSLGRSILFRQTVLVPSVHGEPEGLQVAGTVVGLGPRRTVSVRFGDHAGDDTRTVAAADCTIIRAKPNDCPDGGKCHHLCPSTECFRVQTCEPLSAAGYPDGSWPDEIVAAFGKRAAE